MILQMKNEYTKLKLKIRNGNKQQQDKDTIQNEI